MMPDWLRFLMVFTLTLPVLLIAVLWLMGCTWNYEPIPAGMFIGDGVRIC